MNEINLDALVQYVSTFGVKLLVGLLILVVGLKLATILSKRLVASLSKQGRLDEMLVHFFGSLLRYTIIAVTVITVLNQVGVQTASLLAVLASAGLAIGLALQGTLSNIASGVMLIFFRPFRTGQYVEVAGKAGTVKNVSLFTTELATPDNVQIILPNSQVWSGSIINYSYHDTRRVDFLIGISYEDNIDKAFSVINSVIGGEKRIHAKPAPQVVVSELADSSINITVRVWVTSGDYWGVKFDLTKQFKESMDANGLSIPFPQQDVHLIQSA
ncbi:MAG TPA: mechanosensitive ion channel [Chlorobaculum parvum]|uniref:Mechanosensitive ion channel n=1 Tax=Chlorobaculum parvum TaxID=274539 RepID=A0A7C5DF62_9CHLB|nr:mechanosensitive ion channel [Chlorobaculum parvum]